MKINSSRQENDDIVKRKNINENIIQIVWTYNSHPQK